MHATHSVATVVQVPCPNWGRLDINSGWREFAEGAATAAVTAAVVGFKAEAVLGVDWHALPAWQALTAGSMLQTSDTRPLGATPYIYLNYRCMPIICHPTAFD